jgi:CheY-like chemotaxis protein
MTRMSGLQLAREISRMPTAHPVVLYTGYAEAVDPAECSAAGVKALVRKPLEPGELHAAIIGCLRRDGERPNRPFSRVSGDVRGR